MERDQVRERVWQHLVSKGLTCKKLAVFQTSEADDIAGQVCRDLEIILEQSYVDLVAEWIADAQRLEPIQKRLRGEHVQDPLHDQFLHERCLGPQHDVTVNARVVSFSDLPGGDVRPSRRALRLEGEAGARAQKENDQKEFWSRELYKELRRIDAPALEELEHCVEERHIHLALAGRTRYNTLKRYIKVWRSFFQWVLICVP
jgi:hypothetical protein